MQMGYAIVRGTLVENVIAWDGVTPYTPPSGTILVQTDEAGPGWIYDLETKTFSPPPKSEILTGS